MIERKSISFFMGVAHGRNGRATSDEGHVTFFWRPAMPARFALSQNLVLVRFGQSNVAMTVTMDMHEHGAVDEKGVFVDAEVLALELAGHTDASVPQFLLE